MEEIIENGMGISDTAASDAVEADNVDVTDAEANCDEVGGDDGREAEKSLLEAEIVRLKEAAVRQKEEFEAAIMEMKVKSAVLERLYGEGAKNPKLLMRLIDISKVGFDDEGGLVGLDEQIGGLKENEGYLFVERCGADLLGCFRPEESGDLAETRADFSQMTYSEMIRALGR